MRVFVYFNLHKRVWSVRALEGEHKGRVLQHASALCLADCTFKVSEAGRQRVLRERQKNVHAGVKGTLVAAPPAGLALPRRVTYDPYKYTTFVDADTFEAVHGSPCVLFSARAVHCAR
jgi:hypothetical protein